MVAASPTTRRANSAMLFMAIHRSQGHLSVSFRKSDARCSEKMCSAVEYCLRICESTYAFRRISRSQRTMELGRKLTQHQFYQILRSGGRLCFVDSEWPCYESVVGKE